MTDVGRFMRGPGPHILIVDDDPAVVEALTAALKRTYVVHGAATGKEACALLRYHPIAAIILDAVLGREHGLDLVEPFRALSGAPILMLTGHGSEELAVDAFRAGVSDYFRKPLNLEELWTTLSKLVRQHEERLDPVEQARRILVEHPERPHTTASLAREVGLSEGHLRRQFRATYGKTPRRYLTEVRMQRGLELLRTTSHGIEQVAQAVGFLSATTFGKIFKHIYRMTPSEFRTRGGQAEGEITDGHRSARR